MPRDRRSQTSSERTDEQRELARQERERRRLAKSGSSTPPLPPPEPQVETAPPVEVETPVDVEPSIEAEPPIDLEPPVETASPVEVERPVQVAPLAEVESAVEVESPVEAQPTTEVEPPVETTQPIETPLPLEREPVRKPPGELRRIESVPLPARGQSARPHLHRPHLGHRPHLHRPHAQHVRRGPARVLALLAVVGVLAALVVAALLLTHKSEPPKPPPPPAVVKVVIPEGYTRLQIAALAHADALTGSYLRASKSSPQLSPSHYGAPASTPNLEGFLFPASYELYAHTPSSKLVSEQLAAFRANFGGGEVHRAKVLGITPYELLIVASMVEREAELPHDRSLVAAVIYNRLRLGMALGIDSTLRYALNDFTHPLTEAELHSNSPYNTRVHKGLPPTPISNPGVAAIHAAARPAHVSYLYYVAGADGCGELVFSTSYAKFEADAAAYNDAISRNGGRVPACKKK